VRRAPALSLKAPPQFIPTLPLPCPNLTCLDRNRTWTRYAPRRLIQVGGLGMPILLPIFDSFNILDTGAPSPLSTVLRMILRHQTVPDDYPVPKLMHKVAGGGGGGGGVSSRYVDLIRRCVWILVTHRAQEPDIQEPGHLLWIVLFPLALRTTQFLSLLCSSAMPASWQLFIVHVNPQDTYLGSNCSQIPINMATIMLWRASLSRGS
jgi:hypothetical protein